MPARFVLFCVLVAVAAAGMTASLAAPPAGSPAAAAATRPPKKTTTTSPATTTSTLAPTTTTQGPTTTIAPTTTVAPTTTTTPPPAPIAVRGTPASTLDSGGVVTVKAFGTPTAAVAGDTLVAVLDYKTPGLADIANTAPTGWTKAPGELYDVSTTTGAHLVVATKPAAGGAETPLWSFASAPDSLAITVIAYSGVDPVTPFEKVGYKVEAGGSSTTTHTAPAFTPTLSDTWGLAAFGGRAGESPWTPGAGLVERADIETTTGEANLEAADSNSILPTGSPITYTASEAAGTSVQVSFAGNLRPATEPPPPPPTTTTTVGPTTTTLGGVPPLPAGKTWTNVINDQFTTAGLPSHWGPYNGPNGSNDPDDCSDPANVRVPGDGQMHLDFNYKTSGPCGATWYNGSMMASSAKGGIHQRISVRWRTTATDPVNTRAHYIIPMRWDNDPNYAWWELEHDYCESSTLDQCTTALHHDNGSGGDTWELFTYPVDVTAWHTMQFETYPHPTQAGVVVFNAYIDGGLVKSYLGSSVVGPNGEPPTINEGFRNPVLQTECRSSCPTDTSDSQVFDIDWITVDTLT